MLAALVITCFLLPWQDPVLPSEPNWVLDKFTWENELPEGHGIDIKNPYGDVRARYTEDRVAAVSAIIQRAKQDPKDMRVQVDQTGKQLSIEVVYEGETELKPNTKRRTDITIFVPKNTSLKVNTRGGLIEAKGLKGPVVAKSILGRIKISTSGTVNATTRQGAIDVSLEGTRWQSAPVLQSELGDLRLDISGNAAAILDVATAGDITTDFSIQIKRDDKLPDRKLGTISLAGASSKIRLHTDRGNIQIREKR